MSSTPTLDAPPAGPHGQPGAERFYFRRATRDTQERVIGGVAAGLAAHLGVPVLWVRAAFVVTAALGGAGRRDVRRPVDGAAHRRAVRRGRARSRERHPARARGRVAYAGWSTPAPPSRWVRSASACCCCSQGLLGAGACVLAAADRHGRHRAAVAAGRRGAARAVDRQHRPDRPRPDGVRLRHLAGRRARDRRCPADRAGDRRLRAPRGPDGRPLQRDAVGRRRLPRAGHRHRPLDLPAGRRPDRRAGRAGAHPGARRHGRPPARLGAPDPRPDPEERPRLRARRPAGAVAGA